MVRARTRIKMCGMTRVADISYALELGVDAIGLIFYAASSRNVSIKQAAQLLHHLPPFVHVVAIMVNPALSKVEEIIAHLPINYLQFHGEETPTFCEQFNLPFIKAIPARSSLSIVKALADYNNAAAILLDTPARSQRGGTGQIFDWTIIPPVNHHYLIVAGGLDASNIGHVIECVHPYALDICSGIEHQPGIKSHVKMTEFMTKLREYDYEQ